MLVLHTSFQRHDIHIVTDTFLTNLCLNLNNFVNTYKMKMNYKPLGLKKKTLDYDKEGNFKMVKIVLWCVFTWPNSDVCYIKY